MITMEEQLGKNDLSDLTKNSGGFGFAVPHNLLATPVLVALHSRMRFEFGSDIIGGIKASVKLLHAQISSVYTISLELPGELRKPQSWKLEVVDDQGRSRKDVMVLYPHKLAECAVQSAKSKAP